MTSQLGRWAAIDLETTGLDPQNDHIVDVGFLQFEDCRLVKKYHSLARTEKPLGHFVQTLTGITPEMLREAPPWEDVLPHLQDLQGHQLIAHNAGFEEQFLEAHCEQVQYWDSLPFLALLFPWKSQLKLEHFLLDWNLREKEAHRAFEDGLDLLKVLLTANMWVRRHRRGETWNVLKSVFAHYDLRDTWHARFLNLSGQQVWELAEQLDFDLEQTVLQAEKEEARQRGKSVCVQTADSHPDSFDFTGENIQNLLREEERVEKSIPHYRYRKSQEDLALRVGQSLNNQVHALVQAPTGTGKTLGYLLPSALFALEKNAQVLVATGTKTLQQQVMNQDVPQLRQILGLAESELKIKRLVGSNNHLCELLFRQNQEESNPLLLKRNFEDCFDGLFFEMVFYYNGEKEFAPVLRDQLPSALKRRFENFRNKERELAVDFRACTGAQCPHRHQCSYIQGLREAKDADVIIGNHALMFHWPRSLPRPVSIVVDEAHRIEEEATDAFSLKASAEELESFVRSLQGTGTGALYYLLGRAEEDTSKLREKIHQAGQKLQEYLSIIPTLMENYFITGPRYTTEFWNERSVPEAQGGHAALFAHLESLSLALQNLEQIFAPYAERFGLENPQAESDEEVAAAVTRFQTFLATLEDLAKVLSGMCREEKGQVRSLKFHQKRGYALELAPVDVGTLLYHKLLESSSSVVYTSATLAGGGEGGSKRGVEWITGYAHLPPEKRFRSGLFLPAEYDYGGRAQTYLCSDVPPLGDPQFVESVLCQLIPLIRRLKGRTLLLFGARTRFETACEILWQKLGPDIPLFIQGTGVGVVEDFKKRGGGVLVGMESFGEGIDVPGENLQLVFIDKIPDLPINLVTSERRRFYQAEFGNEFNDYYLSHRTRRLHQKLGRLMRREGDRGGIIIADQRVSRWKPRTLQTLVSFMLPYRLQLAPLASAVSGIEDLLLSKNFPSPPSYTLTQ